MYRTISNKAEEAKEFYEQKYGDNVLNTFLPYWDGLSLGDTESGEFIRKSVPYLNGDDKVKQKINELGKEILERIQNKL
jgi:hypothetical protein